METAGKLLDDEELTEAMKERGLGTPATRAAMIETLLHRKYIERTKTRLTATEAGRCLVALIEDEKLKSPELTGQMEVTLKRIEQGMADPDQFMRAVGEYVQEIIEQNNAASTSIARLGESLGLARGGTSGDARQVPPVPSPCRGAAKKLQLRALARGLQVHHLEEDCWKED